MNLIVKLNAIMLYLAVCSSYTNGFQQVVRTAMKMTSTGSSRNTGTGFNRRPLPKQERTIYKSSEPCLCGSSRTYGECCEPFHNGVIPPNAEKTLRARYTGYALGSPDFIIASSHRDSPEYQEYMVDAQASIKSGTKRWSKDIIRMSDDYQYLGFEVVGEPQEVQEKNFLKCNIKFRVLFREGDGALMAVEEDSTFLNENGRWLYLDGETDDPPEEVVAKMKAEWPSRPINKAQYGKNKDDENKAAVFSAAFVPDATKLRAETIRGSGGLGMGARITHIPKGRA